MGKKEDEIRRIQKEEKLKDYQGLYDELAKETDRAAAVVGAAFLDEKLKNLLKAYFVDDLLAVTNLIGDDNVLERPLSTFGSRVLSCYCLGLISKEIKTDLELICKIRNGFAHGLHGMSFEDEKIKGLSGSLKMVRRLISNAPSYTSRTWFTVAVSHLATDLELKALSVTRLKVMKDTAIVEFPMVKPTNNDPENQK